MDLVVQQRDQRVQGLEADSREALCQHVGPQRHRRPHGAHRQRIAHAGRVAAQQIDLQRVERVGRNLHLGERSESGIDSVDRLVGQCLAIDDGAGGADACRRFGCERDGFGAIGDGQELIERERRTVEQDHRSKVESYTD